MASCSRKQSQVFTDNFREHMRLAEIQPRISAAQLQAYKVIQSFISQRARRVCKLYEKFKHELAYGVPLRKVYAEALRTLDMSQTMLQAFCTTRIRIECPDLVSTTYFDRSTKVARKMFVKNRFEWALRILLSRSSSRNFFIDILQELELYMQDDKNHIHQTTTVVQDILSTMSTSQRMWEMLNHHTPQVPDIRARISDQIFDLTLGAELELWISTQETLFDSGRGVPPSAAVITLMNEESALKSRNGKRDFEWLKHEDTRHDYPSRAWDYFIDFHIAGHYSICQRYAAKGIAGVRAEDKTEGMVCYAEPSPLRAILHSLRKATPAYYLAQRNSHSEHILARVESQKLASRQKQEEVRQQVLPDWAQTHTRPEFKIRFENPTINPKTKTKQGPSGDIASTEDDTEPESADYQSPLPAPLSQEVYNLTKKQFSIIRQLFPTVEEPIGSTVAWQNFLNMMAQTWLCCRDEWRIGVRLPPEGLWQSRHTSAASRFDIAELSPQEYCDGLGESVWVAEGKFQGCLM